MATTSPEKKEEIDLLCVARYAIFGAIVGGFFGDLVSPSPYSVYGTALLVSLAFVLVKVRLLN